MKEDNRPKRRHTRCSGCKGTGIYYIGPACAGDQKAVEDESWHIVERCDTCRQFSSDRCAARYWFADVRKHKCLCGSTHIIARLKSQLEAPDGLLRTYSIKLSAAVGLHIGGSVPDAETVFQMIAEVFKDNFDRFSTTDVKELIDWFELVEETA